MSSAPTTQGESVSGGHAAAPGGSSTNGGGEPTSATSVRGVTSVAGDFAAVASGRTGLAVLSAVSVILATRLLGPRGYALVGLVSIVSTLVWTVSTSWLSTAVRRYGREDFELRGRVNRLTWNRAVIAAPLTLLSVALVVALKAAGALPLGLSWPLVAIAIGFSLALIVVDHLTTVLETIGRMKVSAASQVLSQAGYVGLLAAVYIAAVHVTASRVLLFSLAAYTALALAITALVWRTAVMPPEFDRALLRRMLHLSIPMCGFMVSQYVFASVDIVILKIFRTQADVGVYAVAYQAYTVLSRVTQSGTIVLVPLFVSLRMAGRGDLVGRYMQRGVAQGLFLAAVLTALVIPFLPLLVPLAFGSAFAGATTPMAILLCGLVFLFAQYLIAPVLTLHEQTRAMAVVSAVATLLNIVGDVILVAVLHMGIIAPAIATSAALAFMFVAYFISAARASSVKPHVPLLGTLPLVAALVPVLVWGGFASTVIGLGAVVLTSVAILRVRRPFGPEDAEIVAKLQLPAPVKRGALRALAVLG
jgi:O-antigen/teichoic acid export membrane protein